jgi:hypothetical protein
VRAIVRAPRPVGPPGMGRRDGSQRTGTRPSWRGGRMAGSRVARQGGSGGRPSARSRARSGGATSSFPQPLWGGDREPGVGPLARPRAGDRLILKGLILAQNERWRRGLGMQVERARSSDRASGARVSKATVTSPMVGHSRGKLRVIPGDVRVGHPRRTKAPAPWDGPSWY